MLKQKLSYVKHNKTVDSNFSEVYAERIILKEHLMQNAKPKGLGMARSAKRRREAPTKRWSEANAVH